MSLSRLQAQAPPTASLRAGGQLFPLTAGLQVPRSDRLARGLTAVLLSSLALLLSSGSATAQTTGTRYQIWRVGQNVLGSQTYANSQALQSMSPSGDYASGVRFGSISQGFLLSTSGTPSLTNIPPLFGGNQYGTGMAVNDSGNVVGYQRWTTSGAVTTVGWLYNRLANTTTRLNTPFDANASITAIPTAITAGTTYAFGSVDSDGPAGATTPVGGYWNLSTNTWTPISGIREVLDASADGLTLLVVTTSNAGRIIRGTTVGTYPSTITTFTGRLRGGRVSASGRYIASAETISGVPTPFVYDTQTSTRTNLPLLSADNQGAIPGAVSDTARVLGTAYSSTAGSYAVHWLNPTSAYQTLANILSTDGHTTADPAYSGWNVYNGGGAISASGFTLGVFGNNPLALQDSLLLKQQCAAITLAPTTLSVGIVGSGYSQTIVPTGGVAPYTYSVTSGALPAGLTLNASGSITGTPTSANGTGASITIQARDSFGCTGTRVYNLQVCPVITVSPSSLPGGTVAISYAQTVSASGGLAPYTFAVSSGALPAGLTLNTADGTLSGSPTTPQTQAFTLRATDANGCMATRAYSVIIAPNTDFGDYNALASASSVANSALRIGASVDVEASNPANSTATGDDSTGIDDEDGVVGPSSITAGSVGIPFSVTVTNTTGAPGFLSVWIDFNRNGVLTDAGEQVVSGVSIATGLANSTQNFTFNVPAAASLGTAGVRVRLANSGGIASSGAFGVGEVEDYTLGIIAPITDYGDDIDFADAFSTVNSTLRLGATVDAEGASTRNSAANGDDLTGSDDEDGVTFPSLTAGQPVVLPVTVFNNRGSTGYLNAWIDFNNNGVLTDAGEQIATDQAVLTGTNGTVNVSFNVPTNAVTAASSVGTRFRLTNSSGTLATGGAGSGEVEDHQVVILAPLTDFGDHSGYVDVSNTASSNLRLGAAVDTEYASTRNTSATGDNITGNDDEDGVNVPAMTAGAPASMVVNVTNTSGGQGYLNAWVDFNNDGDFIDSGEQVMTNGGVANGTNGSTVNIGFTVPANATTGVSTGIRVRLTADVSPGVGGSGGVGEVEDYIVTIAAPTTDLGDFSSFADASSTVTSQIRLGTLTDVEYASTKNATATGDDATGSDDEDGVTLPAMTAGGPVTIPVIVTNSSGSAVYLSVWIDFNNNGVLTDADEQVQEDMIIPNGSSNTSRNVNISVPATALTGVNVGVRVRLTSANNAAPIGAAGNGEVEDYIVNIAAPTTDFGDFSGFADASQGANPALRMGATLDTEFASTRNSTATGDDNTKSDDEDGVIMPSMIAGQTVVIPVTITNGTGANGYLNGWIDWNNNGILTDAGEQIATNTLIASGASNAVTNISVIVPPTATTGVALGARFRLSAPSGLGPTGSNALAGEIEDYTVTIAAPTTDFGDYSVFGSASSTVDSNLRLGATADVEYAQTTNTTATGDDITGTDDEDGVTLPSMTSGAPVTLPVVVTNNTGSAAYLNVWIDYNNNGSVTDAGEQVADDVSIASGTSNITQNLAFTVPANAVTGIALGVRVRLVSVSGTAPTGFAGNGEVEDYRVTIAAPNTDFGDYSVFGSVSNARNGNLRLGALVDAEFSATTDATATGDDNTGSDDEDGVSVPAMIAGQTLPLPMTVTNLTGVGAFLNVWVDFNGNGALTDSGEQVVSNLAVANGSNNIAISPNIVVPAGASTGTTLGLRARLVTVNGAGATGALGTAGEIEDYTLTITAPTTDFGDVQGIASASSTVNNSLRIGALTDAEFAPNNNAAATGDDISGSDDEDGVSVPAMMAGAPATLPVTVTNTSGSLAYLNVWIDFNNNGSLADSGENILVNQGIFTGTSAAVQNISFTVPANAVTTTNLGLRVRLTSTSSPGPTGLSGNGEVEDYLVNIATPPLDYGDTNVLASASSTANSALRLGALVDTEFSPIYNSTATGDDNTGSDDEDGVSIPMMTAGAPATITATATNTSGAVAYLNAWIDFNGNGSVADVGEQIATDVNVANGTSAGSIPINFTVPAPAVTGATIVVRARLTSTSSPGISGLSGSGEVEDYVTTIAVPVTDFGDWNGLANASSIQSSNLRMGPLADTEYVSTLNAAASGDDNTASDDEDGVTLAAGYNLGAASSLTVTVTNLSGAAAYLNVWVDFNNNNSVADAGEQIATNTTINNGTNGAVQTVSFTVPATAIPGFRGARFRLSSTSNPGASSASGMGEVEDHLVNIYCPTITLSPTTLNAATVGSAFSQTLSASGGTSPYTWSVSSGTLPAGLTLNASTGVISGTPTTANGAGTSVTITATDVNGCDGDRVHTMKVCPIITVGPSTLATPTVGTAYSQTIVPANGAAPYTFVRSSGTLPTWATLNATTGVISGTPNSTTSASFTIRATDANGCTGTRSYLLTPVCPTISASPATVPEARVNTAYSTTLSGVGGTAPYSGWTIVSGTLPAGLSLNSTSGVISGTPTVVTSPGTSVTVRVTDTYGCQGTQAITVQVCPVITVSPTSLANGMVNLAYSATVSASGGVSPYTFSVTSGTFPAWATLNPSTGAITGTPSTTTSSTFTISADDANGCAGTRSYTITPACPTILISASVLPQATVSTAYSHTLTPNGGVPPYSNFTITSGSLPLGLSLSSAGVISGTAVLTNGTGTSITFRTTDSNGCQGTQTLTFRVCPSITLNPSSLANGSVGAAYSQTLSTSGGTSPYVYGVASGSLPGWATLNTSTGLISGTPNSASSSTFTLRSTDANGCIATRSYTITPVCPAITITPTSLTNGLAGTAYSRTMGASGGTAPYTWSLTSGTLPSGLSLSTAGVLSGTPTAGNGAGTSITFRATDVYGCQQTITLGLQICPVVLVSPASLTAGVVSAPYSQTVTSTGGVAPYVYAVSIGSLPPGLTLDPSTGVISGTPSSAISANFTISTTDANGCAGSRAYTLAVSCPAITISPATLPAGLVGASYSQTVTASGGTAPYVWNVSAGTLPAGLSLSTGGVLSGTPTASNGAGVNVTLRAVDNTGCAVTRAFIIQVCPVIDLSPTTLGNGTVGASYSQTVSGTGGTGPYTFSLASGSLSWATLNATTGAVSGTPTSTATVSFTLRATDANGCSGTRAYSITPVCPVVSITPVSANRGIVGTGYSQTLAASGGTAPYSGWTVVSGSLPAGLNLNSGTGLINGAPTTPNGLGTSFTVQVTDTYGCQGTQVISLQVCPVIAMSPSSMPASVVGTPFSTTISASGGLAPYTYTVSSGTLPAWATFNASTGEISGTPSSSTASTFTLRATDANGCTGTRFYNLAPVCPVITISPTVHTAYLGTSFTSTLTPSGGTAPYGGWAIASGTMPAGLSFNTSTGVISGTATTAGVSSITIRVSDAYGCQTTQSISITAKGLTLGNLVWQDSDNDGVRDAGEPSLAGAQVVLMNPGADNEVGGSSADVQVGALFTTGADGLYSFTNLLPGNYYVRVIPPAGYTQTGGTPATTDNDTDGNNDGSLPDGVGMPLVSPVITLSIGGESITDGDNDPDTNLTVDFGVWSPVGVGNLIFIDINGNGRFDLQEGIEGVYVFIFQQGANVQTDDAVGIARSDHKGRYFIDGLLPGSYFLYIPPSQFDITGPLYGMIPMTSVVAGDDNVGQNLISTSTPATTGASTAVFTLTPGAEPTGTAEAGYEGTVDDAFIDSNNDFTIDLGLRSASGTGYPLAQRDRNTTSNGGGSSASGSSGGATAQPVTYATWTAQHSAADDADLYPALVEYALDTDPSDGRSGAGAVRMEVTAAGHADVLFTRPANGRSDIRHELETSLDGTTWSTVNIAPALSIDSDGRQIVRYASVDETTLSPRALFRLKIMLDSNLDGTAEASATTPEVMFSRETFPVGQRTFSMPLVKSELYAGSITLSGSTATLPQPVTLPVHAQLYLEDTASGLTYEVDESSSTATSIHLEGAAPASLPRAALRVHHTLSDLLPADLFTTDDRVLTFDAATNTFLPCTLTAAGWETNLVLARQSGLLVHLRQTETTLLLTGQVTVKPSLTPATGTRFLGSVSAVVQSPASLGLIPEYGFRASTRPTSATRLRLWKPDADLSQTGYDSLFLSPTQWQRQDDATLRNLTNEKLLEPFRAFFLLP
ncbi:putative Ig domain-containing protein [Brevifollis gellanilyticus]|uniref:Uncharacterized protein n=1 Tax=Brevifollis gellanilyticus TaxID=748831 RepID=A0A512MFQ5_9BACT|nr:putative Ig domain-containing protein [Brevifollis gellanilyticus]GEP45558.1 hypothetical protein BGE01nite_48490 [Brevifollis gellanilyticus]